MISLDKVEESILELEQKDTCFAVCEKLAMLYVVRDNLKNYNPKMQEPVDVNGESDFLKAVNGKNADKVWHIVDKVMETTKVLHPKMYERVICDINDL